MYLQKKIKRALGDREKHYHKAPWETNNNLKKQPNRLFTFLTIETNNLKIN